MTEDRLKTMNIGEKIRRLRTEKLMTQSELAGETITRNMLSLIEKGKALPSLPTLVYLAGRLKVSPGYLLADEAESAFFLKAEKLSEVRIAYEKKDYRICLDLCRRLLADIGKDNELELLIAECHLEVAKEEFHADRIRSACTYFDEAVLHASRSSYYTEHIRTEAELYFGYLETLSPSFASENIDTLELIHQNVGFFLFRDGFCRYLAALGAVHEKEEAAVQLYLDNARGEDFLLAKHITALWHMSKDEYELAAGCLNDILRSDHNVPGAVLYYVFGDLEECCRRLSNPKNAKIFAQARVSQFEKLLSE